MIYIVTLLKTEIEEDKLKIIETKDIAYFTNLFNAQTSVVNNMGDIYDNTWKYVAIKGVTDNKLFANETILDAYFYEYNIENQKYDNILEKSEYYETLANYFGFIKHNNNTSQQKISLDLTKEDTNFMANIKENVAKKNYNEVFNMLSQKEATVSDDLNNQLNEFVKIFEDGFVQLENGITNFFNKFNKH